MEREIEDVVKIAIEAILAALVIATVALCATLGNRIYLTNDRAKSTASQAESKAALYYYDSKNVSYSDAIELITTYTDTYSYEFHTAKTSSPEDKVTYINKSTFKAYARDNEDKQKYKDYWTESNVITMTKSYDYGKPLRSELIVDNSGTITGVKFTIFEF
ncbi:MAG: hypothetical protein IJ593_00855 [Lachnospiraceae bacterium]|nr:hypothetical protein [Lachnospiraceae bacterium]